MPTKIEKDENSVRTTSAYYPATLRINGRVVEDGKKTKKYKWVLKWGRGRR